MILLVATTNQILFAFYFPFDKNSLPRTHSLLSCLVVLYLGIVFSICLLLLASWMENLGTIVEVSKETIEWSGLCNNSYQNQTTILISNITFDRSTFLSTAKVETPQNQLKDHLASCLLKYNQLETALGPFFLLYFCLLQVGSSFSLKLQKIATRSLWSCLFIYLWPDFYVTTRRWYVIVISFYYLANSN